MKAGGRRVPLTPLSLTCGSDLNMQCSLFLFVHKHFYFVSHVNSKFEMQKSAIFRILYISQYHVTEQLNMISKLNSNPPCVKEDMVIRVEKVGYVLTLLNL